LLAVLAAAVVVVNLVYRC